MFIRPVLSYIFSKRWLIGMCTAWADLEWIFFLLLLLVQFFDIFVNWIFFQQIHHWSMCVSLNILFKPVLMIQCNYHQHLKRIWMNLVLLMMLNFAIVTINGSNKNRIRLVSHSNWNEVKWNEKKSCVRIFMYAKYQK